MAKRILVPLDGSPAAERIVPIVADLARGGGACLRLLHVVPEPGLTVECDYLRAQEAGLQGLPVDSVTRYGDPVSEILKEARSFGADLIAVTTAGQSGLRHVALGPVAEQVFLRSATNVLLFHASPRGLAA